MQFYRLLTPTNNKPNSGKVVTNTCNRWYNHPTMKISIDYLSKLANLKLSNEQKEVMEKSIPSVVEHMEEIKELDVANVSETNGVTEEENVWREDSVEVSLSQEEALSNAKKTYKGFFVVPSIFENKE